MTEFKPMRPLIYWSDSMWSVITRISPTAACISWDGETTVFMAELPDDAIELAPTAGRLE